MANWLQPLLGGVGTVLGGPLGGVAGSVLGGALGGGGQKAAQPAAATSNLSEQLRQMAFQRGFLEALGQGPAQSYAPALAQVQQGQQAPQPPATRKSGQRANQAGGAAYSPLQRYFGDAGGGGSSKTQTNTDELLYQRYLQQAMAGQGGLPAGAYQSALTQGTAAIANQAQVAQQGLQGNLAQRGLLSSGLYGSGMGQIDQARMQAMGQFATNLQQSNLEAQRGAQSNAAQLYAAQRNQQTAINAAKPTTWDYLAGLVGAGVSYLTQPNVPQVTWPGQAPTPVAQPVPAPSPNIPYAPYTTSDELWRQAYHYY